MCPRFYVEGIYEKIHICFGCRRHARCCSSACTRRSWRPGPRSGLGTWSRPPLACRASAASPRRLGLGQTGEFLAAGIEPPPRGGWGWGHRYWGPGDWILPFGVGVGLLALAATPSHTTSTVPAAPVQTQPAPPVNVTINNTPASSSVATQDYFYCPAQKGYYPTIPSCPTGWIKITPQG